MLSARSHAKVNLYLEVLRKRSDGYHDIETLFQAISLHDTLAVHAAETLSLETDMPDLPTGPENLVLRAAAMLREAGGVNAGAACKLSKRIPVAAGLAGGSGNAAAALVLLNELWELHWPHERLAELGARLGADIPYCLLGGTAAATGRGDALAPQAPLPRTWLVLLHPPLKLSTAAVYGHPELKPTQARDNALDRTLAAAHAGDWPRAIHNGMERAAFAMHPELAGLKQRLVEIGCLAAAMSGSGPTLFGVCRGEAHAREAAGAIDECPSSVAHTVDVCVQIEEESR